MGCLRSCVGPQPTQPRTRRLWRQLLSVAVGGLDDLAARLTGRHVDERDGIALLVVSGAGVRGGLLPLHATGIVLDGPFAFGVLLFMFLFWKGKN